MAESSIHFDKSKPNWEQHMFRKSDKLPSYLLAPEDRQKENEYQEPTVQDVDLYNAEMKLLQGRGKRPKLENCLREAVVNLNENHTLADVKKVAELCEKTFGIKCTCIAIHHDEGYKDEQGNIHFNHHAHLHFFTMQNGKQMWQLGKTKRLMSKLQTDVAKILGMKRGKENSKAQRLEHKQYKAVIKEKEMLLKKIKQLSKKRSKATKNALSYRRQKKELIKELKKLELRLEKPTLFDSVKNFLNQPKEPKVIPRSMTSSEIKRTDVYKDLLQKHDTTTNALNSAKDKISNLENELSLKNKQIEELKKQLQELEAQKPQWVTENQKAKEQGQEQIHSQDDYKPLNAQIREVKKSLQVDTIKLGLCAIMPRYMTRVVDYVAKTFPNEDKFNIQLWAHDYMSKHQDDLVLKGQSNEETSLRAAFIVAKALIFKNTGHEPSDNTLLQKMLGHPLETQQNLNLGISDDRVEQADDITIKKSVHRSR